MIEFYFSDRQNLSGVKAVSKIQGLFLQALYNKLKSNHKGKIFFIFIHRFYEN